MSLLFEELFTYNRYCNLQLTVLFMEQSDQVDVKSMSLFSHVLNAHQIWNNRILGQPAGCGVWESRPSDAFEAIDQYNHGQTMAIIGSLDLTKEVAYTTSNGQPFTNTVGNILFHVVNHSTYHRGQIALLFRQNGIKPLVTDFIAYKRQ